MYLDYLGSAKLLGQGYMLWWRKQLYALMEMDEAIQETDAVFENYALKEVWLKHIKFYLILLSTVGTKQSPEWMCIVWHGRGHIRDSSALELWKMARPSPGKTQKWQSLPWIRLRGMARLSPGPSMNADNLCGRFNCSFHLQADCSLRLIPSRVSYAD